MREGCRNVVSDIVEEILKLRENEKDEYTEIIEEGIKSICFSILSIFLRNLDGVDLKKLIIIINDLQLGRIVEKLKISDEQVVLKLLSKSLNMEFNKQISNIYLEGEDKASVELTLKNKTMHIEILRNAVKSIENLQSLQEVFFYIDDPFVLDELTSFGTNDFYSLSHRETLIQKIKQRSKRSI